MKRRIIFIKFIKKISKANLKNIIIFNLDYLFHKIAPFLALHTAVSESCLKKAYGVSDLTIKALKAIRIWKLWIEIKYKTELIINK